MELGAVVGELIDPAGGGVAGALIGSMVGVGGGISYVPSTDNFYAGPVITFAPQLFSGYGWNASTAIVPSGTNPNSIANGQSYSVTFQPTTFTGSTVTKSPGSPAVAGPSVGSRSRTTTFSASYSFDITPAARAVRSAVQSAVSTVRGWFQ